MPLSPEFLWNEPGERGGEGNCMPCSRDPKAINTKLPNSLHCSPQQSNSALGRVCPTHPPPRAHSPCPLTNGSLNVNWEKEKKEKVLSSVFWHSTWARHLMFKIEHLSQPSFHALWEPRPRIRFNLSNKPNGKCDFSHHFPEKKTEVWKQSQPPEQAGDAGRRTGARSEGPHTWPNPLLSSWKIF